MKPWREKLFAMLGPPLLTGARFSDWCRLLWSNRFAVHPRYSPRACFITGFSLLNSTIGFYERLRYKMEDIPIESPLFILGHWRSGTTHLFNLLSQDRRFGYPTLYEVLFPHTFLSTESLIPKLLNPFLPKRRPTDNVRFALDVPYEDEFAICVSSFCSPYMSMIFPRRQSDYDRYLSLQDVTEEERRRWQTSLKTFLQKVAWKQQRPLLIKSPGHTARVKLLLEMFPDAKFLHLSRHPYAVYQSCQKIVAESDRRQCLQKRASRSFDDRIVFQFKEMYDSFLEDRSLIPEGHLHEMRFEDLEQDPLGQVKTAYEALRLPDFQVLEPDLQNYLASVAHYKKNEFPQLPPEVREKLAAEWSRYFHEFGYPAEP